MTQKETTGSLIDSMYAAAVAPTREELEAAISMIERHLVAQYRDQKRKNLADKEARIFAAMVRGVDGLEAIAMLKRDEDLFASTFQPATPAVG